jgi:predicted DNA-binding transcriptional regulator AlpA
VKLGARAVAWPESVVDELVSRLASGHGAAHE